MYRYLSTMFPQLNLHGKKFVEKGTIHEPMRFEAKMHNDACLMYILNGSNEFFGPTESYQVGADEGVLMKCGNYLASFKPDGPTQPFESLVFHLDPESIRKSFGSKKLDFLIAKDQYGLSTTKKHFRDEQLKSFVNSFLVYFDHPELVNEEILEVKLQELVLILSDFGKDELSTSLLASLYEPADIQFENIVEANVFNRLSVAELALLTNRSESTFKRDFKKYYNDSPAHWIKNKRLERASDLLLMEPEKPVSEIAWECGFENTSHFSTAFLSKFSKSPRDFRSEALSTRIGR